MAGQGEFWLFVTSSGKRDGSVIVEFEYVPDKEEYWTRDPDGTWQSSHGIPGNRDPGKG